MSGESTAAQHFSMRTEANHNSPSSAGSTDISRFLALKTLHVVQRSSLTEPLSHALGTAASCSPCPSLPIRRQNRVEAARDPIPVPSLKSNRLQLSDPTSPPRHKRPLQAHVTQILPYFGRDWMREDRGVGEEHIRCGRRAGTAAGSMLAPPEGARHRDAFPHDAFTPLFPCTFSIFFQASQLRQLRLENHEKKSRMIVRARRTHPPLFDSKSNTS
jgi:hypothetical protein